MIAIDRDEVRRLLDEYHRRVAQFGWSQLARAEGALSLARDLRILSDDEYRERFTKVHYCPGHFDGQIQCGYGCRIGGKV